MEKYESQLVPIFSKIKQILEKADSQKKKCILFSHADVDGISSLKILSSLKEIYPQINFEFNLLGFFSIKSLQKKIFGPELLFFLDLGAAFLPELSIFKNQIIILDHHKLNENKTKPQNLIHVNPELFGEDGGRTGCGASLSFALLFFLDSKQAIKKISYFFAGMIGDKQDRGAPTWVNRELIHFLLQQKKIKKSRYNLNFLKSTGETLKYSFAPIFPSFFGKINKKINKKECYNLMLKQISGLKNKCIKKEELKEIYYSPLLEPFYFTFFKIYSFFATHSSNMFLESNEQLQKKKLEEFKKKILIPLSKEINKTYIDSKKYFYIVYNFFFLNPLFVETIYLYKTDANKPIVSIKTTKYEHHLSFRCTRELVEKGINFAHMLSKIFKKMPGTGGGHKIAAGAKIKIEHLDQFLDLFGQELKKFF